MEPAYRTQARTNHFAGRWSWWYPAIADWMIRNPGGTIKDCAAELNRHPNTISMIAGTDMFREYMAQRREEWRQHHDFALISKVTKVAEAGLDVLLEKLEKKKDQIPMQLVTEVAMSALDRLGYGPRREPAVAVNVQQNDNRVVVAVDANALAEAREAMRLAEARTAYDSRLLVDATPELSQREPGGGVADAAEDGTPDAASVARAPEPDAKRSANDSAPDAASE
jgi:hypothetical protein